MSIYRSTDGTITASRGFFMIIHYEFIGEYEVDENRTDTWGIGSYDFEVDPDYDDYIDFLLSYKARQEIFYGYENPSAMSLGASVALRHILSENDFIGEYLNEDQDFIEYMRDEYEDEAQKEWAEAME